MIVLQIDLNSLFKFLTCCDIFREAAVEIWRTAWNNHFPEESSPRWTWSHCVALLISCMEWLATMRTWIWSFHLVVIFWIYCCKCCLSLFCVCCHLFVSHDIPAPQWHVSFGVPWLCTEFVGFLQCAKAFLTFSYFLEPNLTDLTSVNPSAFQIKVVILNSSFLRAMWNPGFSVHLGSWVLTVVVLQSVPSHWFPCQY